MRTALALLALTAAAHAGPSITDPPPWTEVEAPASPFFTSTVNGPASIALTALDASPGSIPAGTDIGYQSVDGETVATSTAGFALSRDVSFQVAIDYAATFANASDGLSFGFGVGEDRSGLNSAGVGFATQQGAPAAIPFAGPAAGAATVNDQAIPALLSPAVSALPATLSGSFHVSYDAATGNITVGRGLVGASSPTSTATFTGADVANNWTPDADLLVAFFIRSDTITVPLFGTVSTPWSAGEGDVTFSNLRVLSGEVVPIEPVNQCPADFNNDGVVDGADFGAFGAAFGSSIGTPAYTPAADFNADGQIDGADFGSFGAEFGRTDCLD